MNIICSHSNFENWWIVPLVIHFFLSVLFISCHLWATFWAWFSWKLAGRNFYISCYLAVSSKWGYWSVPWQTNQAFSPLRRGWTKIWHFSLYRIWEQHQKPWRIWKSTSRSSYGSHEIEYSHPIRSTFTVYVDLQRCCQVSTITLTMRATVVATYHTFSGMSSQPPSIAI